jgi:hypothetical protein
VDGSLVASSDGNGVLEPGEAAQVAPSWTFQGFQGFGCTARAASGKASKLAGPAGGDYVIGHDAAQYGLIGTRVCVGRPMCMPAIIYNIGPCGPGASNCYAMSVSAAAGRPAPHWDATFQETVSYKSCGELETCGPLNFRTHAWTLHVGDSFTDVPRSQPFYRKIETLLHKGITLGCAPTQFCPGSEVSRGQLATFVARSIARLAAAVPASGTVGDQPYDCSAGGVSLFSDVAPTDAFCKHIHYVASLNVDGGCEPGLFCPDASLTRLQMAAVVAKAIVEPGGDAAVPSVYTDAVTGRFYNCDPGSENFHFTDVPPSDAFCRHASYLWARGVIAGCSPTEFCPAGDVTRAEMAKFLVNAFKLTLYGP